VWRNPLEAFNQACGHYRFVRSDIHREADAQRDKDEAAGCLGGKDAVYAGLESEGFGSAAQRVGEPARASRRVASGVDEASSVSLVPLGSGSASATGPLDPIAK